MTAFLKKWGPVALAVLGGLVIIRLLRPTVSLKGIKGRISSSIDDVVSLVGSEPTSETGTQVLAPKRPVVGSPAVFPLPVPRFTDHGLSTTDDVSPPDASGNKVLFFSSGDQRPN